MVLRCYVIAAYGSAAFGGKYVIPTVREESLLRLTHRFLLTASQTTRSSE